jgi:hypothetical protein
MKYEQLFDIGVMWYILIWFTPYAMIPQPKKGERKC